MSTLFHPHITCVWGHILIGLGAGVRAFKPSCDAFQAVGECTNHLHHIHHSGITILTSWWFTSPISPVSFRSSRPWSTCILYCSQLLTIWSSMPLKSAVVTHIVWSRTSLWSRTRLGSGFRLAHRLLMGVVQHSLVIHIPLFLHLGLLNSRNNFNLLFGFYKLHFFGDTTWWTTSSGISQPGLVWELFEMKWHHLASWWRPLYLGIGLYNLLLKKSQFCVRF